ncbi:MAG: cyclic di-GMP phosphodiesterase [Phycisphaerales bacterium]|jgi:putative two-component system response regulator|nr:cyclic di-GMP phosphodiesterase [Phycisphaerales bacterium]MEA2733689.1 cyclic di-GMP phosphodiesterase [Humisphaera sp.]
MRILIVDDNEIALEMLKATLTQAGYEVETATNGREALERLRDGSCRLLVSDWEMPEMDGIQLCQAVRSGELPAYVYMILLTARDRPDERVAGLTAGADDFIVKPFNPAELLARVRTAERVLSLETRDVAIFAMAKLAESRDPETGAHLERVRGYARLLAQQVVGMEKFRSQVRGEYVALIYQTSPLHDIGKVGIPDSVLLKPGRLSDREFEIMKTHTTIGAQTLEAALQQFPGVKFLEMARDITISHHERFDGSGYPHGLKGEEIPLAGRIVALADVYDALTSKRVYKGAFAHDVARPMLLQESGTHFDPAIVDAFIQCESQFITVRDRYSESRIAA